MNDADKLRKAADHLRSCVTTLTTDTDRWDEAFRYGGVYGDRSTYERLFVHPGVGLALAEWLDHLSAVHEATLRNPRKTYYAEPDPYLDPLAVRVADLILGGAS